MRFARLFIDVLCFLLFVFLRIRNATRIPTWPAKGHGTWASGLSGQILKIQKINPEAMKGNNYETSCPEAAWRARSEASSAREATHMQEGTHERNE